MRHAVGVVELKSTILSGALKVGEFAVVVSDGHQADKHIVAKVYGGVVVSLNDPNLTWEHSYGDDGFYVRRLLKGDTITLTVGAGEEELVTEVKQFLDKGQVINAIKRVREVTNLGLKEAKDFVDNIRKDYAPAVPVLSNGFNSDVGSSW
jgi:hypothetical protein